MEITTEALRKIDALISTLPNDISHELLAKLPIEADAPSDGLAVAIDKSLNEKWTNHQYKTLWQAAEVSLFFNHWMQPFIVKPTKMSLSNLKKKLESPEFSKNQLITLELSNKPQLLLIARTPSPHRSMIDKTLSVFESRDSLYWFPKLGIALTSIHSDDEGNKFTAVLKSKLFPEMTEYRFKSLTITQMYKFERFINQLVVNADFQITGFDGLNEIRFIGPDVKRGLSGLNRRQDIRVHMNEIGPNIEVENKNWKVKIGSNLRLKTLVGIYEIHMLFHQDQYPTQEQVMSLKEKFQTEEEIRITDLQKDWGTDTELLEYYVIKLIENGILRGKVENGRLVKN